MYCSSQIGKPNVNIDILSSGEGYTWHKNSNHYIWRRLVNVGAADNGSSFDCSMNSSGSRFSGMERTCTIGPVTVVPVPTTVAPVTASSTTTRPTTEHPDASINHLDASISTAASQHTASWKSTTASEEEADGVPSSISTLPLIVAFLVTLLLLLVSVNLNIILIVKRLQRSTSKEIVQTNAVKTGSNVELQFEGDKVFYKVPSSKKTLQDVSSTYEDMDDLQSIKNPVYQNVRC
ncbi:uncharacterized protein [Asterias amurensis]|uniref:uncharacterized protein n=1 Tax=Asterias amurensis TaxID=7602 RepID=UPI003AB134BE